MLFKSRSASVVLRRRMSRRRQMPRKISDLRQSHCTVHLQTSIPRQALKLPCCTPPHICRKPHTVPGPVDVRRCQKTILLHSGKPSRKLCRKYTSQVCRAAPVLWTAIPGLRTMRTAADSPSKNRCPNAIAIMQRIMLDIEYQTIVWSVFSHCILHILNPLIITVPALFG